MTLSQKILYYILIALLVLMVLFSLQSVSNLGQRGYDSCVQEKCDDRGDEFCQKTRELNNCCLGAGGNLAQSDGKLVCAFT
jgi:hypothetical protein